MRIVATHIYDVDEHTYVWLRIESNIIGYITDGEKYDNLDMERAIVWIRDKIVPWNIDWDYSDNMKEKIAVYSDISSLAIPWCEWVLMGEFRPVRLVKL